MWKVEAWRVFCLFSLYQYLVVEFFPKKCRFAIRIYTEPASLKSHIFIRNLKNQDLQDNACLVKYSSLKSSSLSSQSFTFADRRFVMESLTLQTSGHADGLPKKTSGCHNNTCIPHISSKKSSRAQYGQQGPLFFIFSHPIIHNKDYRQTGEDLNYSG